MMTATELNAKWDTLSSSLNTYPDLDKSTTFSINKAISDWQDWYYSEDQYDHWGDTTKWEKAYNTANEMLIKSIKVKKLKKKRPIVTTAKKKTVVAPPLLVTGRVPFDWRFWLAIGGTVGLLGVLWYMDEKDKKRYG